MIPNIRVFYTLAEELEFLSRKYGGPQDLEMEIPETGLDDNFTTNRLTCFWVGTPRTTLLFHHRLGQPVIPNTRVF